MTIRSNSIGFATVAAVALTVLLPARDAAAQWTPEKPGSENITVLGHLPLGPRLSVSDTDIEQELDRPYAYVGRMVYGFEGDKGVDIIDLHDPTKPERIYSWRIEDQDRCSPAVFDDLFGQFPTLLERYDFGFGSSEHQDGGVRCRGDDP
ncbi:MAG: hypothetical protein QGG24_05285, partial [Vicinamibacterales bacterium]|nr:hypothetical protein [Vicinamibacterales bacterium]